MRAIDVKPTEPTYTVTVDGYSEEHGLSRIDATRLMELLEMHFPGARIADVKEL